MKARSRRPRLRHLSPRAIGAVAALAALTLDQAHKYWMLKVYGIAAHAPVTLAPFLDLVLSWNYGVSYSLFATHDIRARSVMLAVQGAIVIGLAIWLRSADNRLNGLALGLVIGGALGNMIDRLARGAVADFFYLHTTLPVGPLANYVFNAADMAITVGVALLLYESLAAPRPLSNRQ